MDNSNGYPHIPAEKFRFAHADGSLHDKKLETRPVGYFRDAWNRFRKNRASVAASAIILLLLLFAVVGPIISPYDVTYSDMYMLQKLPKIRGLSFLGMDGCTTISLSEADYWYYRAIGAETGLDPIVKVLDEYDVQSNQGTLVTTKHFYRVKLDTYLDDGVIFLTMTTDQFQALQKYQDDTGIQVIYPAIPVNSKSAAASVNQYDANSWYETSSSGTKKGLPVGLNTADGTAEWQSRYAAYTGSDGYTSRMRLEGENNYTYSYSVPRQGGQFYVRVSYYKYYRYLNGFDACFWFGSNQYGQDIFVRLAAGARFSFLLAISVSVINLLIGAIYGAIEGYYGGVADMIMERIAEILSGVPFIVVVTLFQLHLAGRLGVIPCLLFAFVSTGWISTASLVRTQFYRYKNQEYILAARTLGSGDVRLMLRHIFPNSIGTIITSTVLVIPGVIFSESTLSYLNIVNLESSAITSVGTLLANGQGQMSSYPHIIFFPALFISLLMISFNLFGNGLRDAFNPSLRGSEE